MAYGPESNFFLLSSPKDMLIDFRERERGERERKRERNINVREKHR